MVLCFSNWTPGIAYAYSPTLTCYFSLLTVCPKEAIPLSGSGKISSTNYPKSNYTASRNCTWNITAPADKIVNFTFTDFVLSECSANGCSDSCSYVELYDGGSTSSPSLGRFCQGSSWNEPQLSNGNQMFVMFHPGQTVDSGFEARFEATTTDGEYAVIFILNIHFYNHQTFFLGEIALDALRNRLCLDLQLIPYCSIFKRQTDFRRSSRSSWVTFAFFWKKNVFNIFLSRGSQWGWPIAVKRPKALHVRRRNWQILEVCPLKYPAVVLHAISPKSVKLFQLKGSTPKLRKTNWSMFWLLGGRGGGGL